MHSPLPMPEHFALSPEYIDVWITSTDLDDHTLAAMEATLSTEERSRIQRIRIPAKQREALVSRGLLRSLLATTLHASPASFTFCTGPHGKPYLDPTTPHGRVRFNVSHTAGRVMVAMTLDHDLGADIETIRENRSHTELAQRFFTAQEASLVIAAPAATKARTFFTCWCRKEAVLKATGLGIAAGLQTFDVPVNDLAAPATISRFDGVHTRFWQLHAVAVEAPFVASVAIEPCRATMRRWLPTV